MSQGHPYHANEAAFPGLRSRVVVLTGGASGIGRATVERLHSLGARVVFADLPTSSGASLASALSTPDAPVTFVPCDVGVYADNVRLFRTAWELYGRVEHAVACAGVLERGRWFDVEETREGVEREPEEGVVRVNLVGSAWFLRIAGVYLRDRGGDGEGEGDGGMGRSVTLLSSAAGFRRSPGLPMYQASKHGVQGLLRSLEVQMLASGVRLNTINPGMTETAMTTNIVDSFRAGGQTVNSADDIAKMILGLMVDGDAAGRGIFVDGGQGWDVERGYWDEMPTWLGEEPTRRIRSALDHVGVGAGWKIK